MSFAALVVAACIYVSSSAIAVKALTDFRRLADDETDMVLAILLFEDVVIAAVLGFVATGGGELSTTASVSAKAILFVALSLAASSGSARTSGGCSSGWSWSSSSSPCSASWSGMSALALQLDMSEAIGALMAGVILSESGVREEIEQRFFAVRDVFGALFFFVFALTIDLGALGEVGWIVLAALVVTVVGKVGVGLVAGRLGGYTARQGINAGAALVAHGEFTIIIAQLAAGNAVLAARRPAGHRRVRRSVRPRDGDGRRPADEGVQADRAAARAGGGGAVTARPTPLLLDCERASKEGRCLSN